MSPKTLLLNCLVKLVCKREKGKTQLNAGQAREVIKVIAELSNEDFESFHKLLNDYCVAVAHSKKVKQQ